MKFLPQQRRVLASTLLFLTFIGGAFTAAAGEIGIVQRKGAHCLVRFSSGELYFQLLGSKKRPVRLSAPGVKEIGVSSQHIARLCRKAPSEKGPLIVSNIHRGVHDETVCTLP